MILLLPTRSIRLLAASLALLLTAVAAVPAAAQDALLEGGPLAGRSNLVESKEHVGILHEWSRISVQIDDFPSQTEAQRNVQTTYLPVDWLSATGPGDGNRGRGQLGGAAGNFDAADDLDGDFSEEVLVVYETNYRDGAGAVHGEKALRMVLLSGVTIDDEMEFSPNMSFSGGPATLVPPHKTLDQPGGTSSYDRGLRVAAGQLDGDPEDEAVVAWWSDEETIQLVVVEFMRFPSVDSPRTLLPIGAVPVPMEYVPRRMADIGRDNITFALAVGDYDGDLVDEIALVYPGVNEEQDVFGRGFRRAHVKIFEYTGWGSLSVMSDPQKPDPGQRWGGERWVGGTVETPQSRGVVDSGGGTFEVPFPGDPGALTLHRGVRTDLWLKRLHALTANLPYTPIEGVDRPGAPRESLVVGLHMQQHNRGVSWQVPTGLAWLRPSSLAEDCEQHDDWVEGDYCLRNEEPVLNHARDTVQGYGDEGRAITSNFCIAAANFRGDNVNGDPGGSGTANDPSVSGADEIVMMFDPHIYVLQAVAKAKNSDGKEVDGADLKASDEQVELQGPWNLVNADPDGARPNCPGDGTRTGTWGACRTYYAENQSNRNSSSNGQFCSVSVVDLNGDQPVTGELSGFAPEIQISLNQGWTDEHNERTFSLHAHDLSRNAIPELIYLNKHDTGYPSVWPRLSLYADLDGDGVRLGPPVRHYTTGADQPLVVLGAPPIHFDIIDGEVVDPLGCFPNFQDDCPFFAEYSADNLSANTFAHTYSSDWSVANTTSVCTGDCSFGIGPKVEASLTTSYGEQFSSTQTGQKSVSVSQAIETLGGKDSVQLQSNTYDVWEYPLLCKSKSADSDEPCLEGNDTVAVALPTNDEDPIFARWPPPVERYDTGKYLATHESGNMLSYKSQEDMETYTKDLVVYSRGGYEVNVNSALSYEVVLADQSSSSQSEGSVFSIESEIEGSGSFGIFDVSSTFSGGYSTSDLISKSALASDEEAMLLTLGRLPIGKDDNSFLVYPYVYLKSGAFVLDYAVEGPANCPVELSNYELFRQNCPNSFFARYAYLPDPAFRLPQRLDEERGLSVNVADRARRTTEILVEPVATEGDPVPGIEPGREVNLRTRVHNYSLVPLDVTTTVSFWQGEPGRGGTWIGEERIASIPARGTREIPNPVPWSIPPACEEGESNGASCLTQQQWDRLKLFAKLDIGGTPEIHTENNLAWRPLSADPVPEPSGALLAVGALGALAALRRVRSTGRRRRGARC